MSSKKTYAVAMVGIPDHERQVLTNIFKLSLYRPRSYAIVNGISERAAEILMVDADDPKALAEWRALGVGGTGATRPTFASSGQVKPSIPTVMVTKDKSLTPPPQYIRRPFVATRVLSILDQMPIEGITISRERVIGELNKQPTQAKPASPPPYEAEARPPVINNPQENRTTQQQMSTALVVDDSLSVRKQIELELKLSGIQVYTAETGEQAFSLLDQQSFDIIFLDVVLPGVDGYQVCKAIKRHKERKKIPVVMLTGKSSPFDRVRGALSGCDTYLTKPVKQSSFHKVLKKYLHC